MPAKATLSYCASIVRKQAPDLFFSILFLPADRREAVYTILAFYYEIEKIRFIVKEKMLGMIRLQWWRDEISIMEKAANLPVENIKELSQDPLVQALAQCQKNYQFDFMYLLQILKAQDPNYIEQDKCKSLDIYLQRCQAEFLPVVQLIGFIVGKGERQNASSYESAFAQAEICIRHLRFANRYSILQPVIFPIFSGEGQRCLQNQQNNPDLQDMVKQIITEIEIVFEMEKRQSIKLFRNIGLYHGHYIKRIKSQKYHLFSQTYQRSSNSLIQLKICAKSLV